MPLPTPDAYNDAIQNARQAFADPELAAGAVECNAFGIPKALGGGFAITYRVRNGGRSFAVRCFHKEVHDLQDRYRLIHNCLKAARLSPFVECEYQQEGICVRGGVFPIVKMEWVEGTTLGEYVEQNHGNRQAMERLRSQFAALEQELASNKIAHGDLQNGNVLVENTQLRLVDYDGMFVKGMPLGKGTELGHKHFQHPLRRGTDFGPDVDRFSFIVIDVSLWALNIRPDLFKSFSTGENILFSANDFADPDSSRIFQMLRPIGDSAFQQSVRDLINVCKGDTKSVPRLPDFLSRRAVPSATIPKPSAPAIDVTKYIGALPVVDAASFELVCRHKGDRVELVGQVVEIETGTHAGKPFVCIHFRKLQDNCVRATILSEGLKALRDTPDTTWVGKWLVINGLIFPASTKYSSGWITIGPTVTDSSQLRMITKEEGLWRLGRGPRTGAVVNLSATPVQNKNAEILIDLGVVAKPTAQKPLAVTKPTAAGAASNSMSSATPSAPNTNVGQSAVKAHNEQVLQNIGAITQNIAGKTPAEPISGNPTTPMQPKPMPTGCGKSAALILAFFLAIVSYVLASTR